MLIDLGVYSVYIITWMTQRSLTSRWCTCNTFISKMFEFLYFFRDELEISRCTVEWNRFSILMVIGRSGPVTWMHNKETFFFQLTFCGYWDCLWRNFLLKDLSMFRFKSPEDKASGQVAKEGYSLYTIGIDLFVIAYSGTFQCFSRENYKRFFYKLFYEFSNEDPNCDPLGSTKHTILVEIGSTNFYRGDT